MTMRREGLNQDFRPEMSLIMPLIICSADSKSAITPSFNGRIVSMFLWVFPCICCARRPMATTLPVIRSLATMEGSSTTTLSWK